MRLFLTFCILLGCFQLLLEPIYSQAPAGVVRENIIPNASFEKYASTPIGWFYKGQHFTTVMKYWKAPTGASPDIFGPKVRVPAQWAEKGFGKQGAHSGVSMSGITAYGFLDNNITPSFGSVICHDPYVLTILECIFQTKPLAT